MTDLASMQSRLLVEAVEPFILRIPLDKPVRTPMGMVDSTIALLLRVRLTTGEEGWGEAWCNFPRFSAFHRAVMIKRVIEPFLQSREFDGPHDAWVAMHEAFHVLGLQGGEPGPLASVIAGVDIALWDIVGKREKQPIWKLLGGRSGTIDTYASLGRSHGGERLIDEALKRGFRGFKLRCWGDPSDHIGAYEKARTQIGPHMALMADCNSSWPLDRAAAYSQAFAGVNLAFLEEPVPVDAPAEVWRDLAARAPTALAGGENMIAAGTFESAIASGVYGVIQPDICKWGGFSGVLPLARRIIDSGARYCPHIFSGAPGLLASAHVLAASNSPDGALEYGIEYNPPRDDFVRHVVRDGRIDIGEAPGLGVELDMAKVELHRAATPQW